MSEPRSTGPRTAVAAVALAAACGAGLLWAGPSASAAAPGAWRPYRAKPFVDVGVCSFPVRGDIVRDEEEVRTLATYPDGKVKREEYRGPLVVRFTGNGRSVVRDVSGYAWFDHARDGTLRGRLDGGLSFRVKQGNVGYPAGDYIIHGRFHVVVKADGNRVVRPGHATVENLCRTLG